MSSNDQKERKEDSASDSQRHDASLIEDTKKRSVAKGNPTGVKKKAKQYRAKKPKDMPRRPLSAYNIFFKEERARMLTEISQKTGPGEVGDVGGGASNPPADKKKIGFETMAKTIGKRWKELPADQLERFKDLAQQDMLRYRREMDEYHLELAKKSRMEREEASRVSQQVAGMITGEAPSVSTDLSAAQQMPNSNFAVGGGFSLEQMLRAQQSWAMGQTGNTSLDPQLAMPANLAQLSTMLQGAGASQFSGFPQPYAAMLAGLPQGIQQQLLQEQLMQQTNLFQQQQMQSSLMGQGYSNVSAQTLQQQQQQQQEQQISMQAANSSNNANANDAGDDISGNSWNATGQTGGAPKGSSGHDEGN